MKAKKADILAIIVSAIFFILLFSFVRVLYLNYNFTVFDLGINFRTEYLFIHTHTLINWPYSSDIITPSTYGKLIYVVLSPFFLIWDSPQMFLLIVVLSVSAGSFFLYKILYVKTSSYTLSFLSQFLYFLYPGVYGFIPNGGNFIIFISTFILASYYFFTTRRFKLALMFLLLGSITGPFSPIIILMFYLVELLIIKYKKLLTKIRNFFFSKNKKPVVSSYNAMPSFFIPGIVLICSAILSITLVMVPLSTLIPTTFTLTRGTNEGSTLIISLFQNLLSNATLKVQFFEELLQPFLYLSILSPYGLLIVGYFLLASITNYYPYLAFVEHYTFMVMPFVFIGMAYNIQMLSKKKAIIKKIMTAIIIASLFSFFIYSPLSLSNIQNGTLNEELHQTPIQKDLTAAFGKIPLNASVFTQNSFPQLMNRKVVYMPGSYFDQKVDYAVIDPYGIAPMSSPFIGFNSTCANFFADNSSYGLFEFVAGISIFKFQWDHNPILNVPFYQNITIDKTISGNEMPTPAYAGPYEYYPPGEYEMSYFLEFSGNLSALTNTTIAEWTWVDHPHIVSDISGHASILNYTFVNLSELKTHDNYYIYSVKQNFTSYFLKYQPNLLIENNENINYTITIQNFSLKYIS